MTLVLRSTTWPVLLSLLAALGLLAGCALGPSGGAASRPAGMVEASPKAPEVTYTTLEGMATKTSDYKGRSVVVVNFWGLRCQNCIEEMPFLERLHHKYGSRGLVILGVNTDGVDGAALKGFLPQLPLQVAYPIIVDPEFSVVEAYQMTAAPLTVVIAKDGTVRFRHEGYEPSIEQEYVDLIEKLLAD